MDKNFRKAAETVAAAIRELAKETPGVTVLVEDKGDIVFEAQKALSKAGVTVVVTVDRFARRANSGQLLAGTLTLDVTASENVPLNRARPDAVTAQMVAEALATGLHWRAFGGRIAAEAGDVREALSLAEGDERRALLRGGVHAWRGRRGGEGQLGNRGRLHGVRRHDGGDGRARRRERVRGGPRGRREMGGYARPPLGDRTHLHGERDREGRPSGEGRHVRVRRRDLRMRHGFDHAHGGGRGDGKTYRQNSQTITKGTQNGTRNS